ncbi:MAG: RNA methyltransferase [Pseudomonadota bacterium]
MTAPIRIISADDPRIAAYASIREKDLTRGHGGRFIVEGKVTLETLIRRSAYQPESLFLSETRVDPLAPLLADVPDEVPIYVAPQKVMDRIAGFPIHRGVLACAKKPATPDLSSLLATAKTVLVLIGLSNHDNVGGCFRNAAAFGADLILLDDGSCDPFYRKSIRVSAGTVLSVPFHHGTPAPALLQAISDAGLDIWCLTPRANAVPIADLERPDRLALVLGAEGPGLSENLISQGTAIRIPMVAGFDSLNVATAGAIALNHVFM